jgi:hypothetical protein
MADFGHLLQESLAASGQAQIDQARALALTGDTAVDKALQFARGAVDLLRASGEQQLQAKLDDVESSVLMARKLGAVGVVGATTVGIAVTAAVGALDYGRRNNNQRMRAFNNELEQSFVPHRLAGQPCLPCLDQSSSQARRLRIEKRQRLILHGERNPDPAVRDSAKQLKEDMHAVELARLSDNSYTQFDPKAGPQQKKPPEPWQVMTEEQLRAAKLSPELLEKAKAVVYTLPPDFPFEPKTVVAFRGTTADPEDILTDHDQALGLETEQYKAATDLGRQLRLRIPGAEVTGHSLGGGKAQAAGVIGGLKGSMFNAAGLHPKSVRLTPAELERHAGRFQQYRAEGADGGDPLTGLQNSRAWQQRAYGGAQGLQALAQANRWAFKELGIEDPIGLLPDQVQPIARGLVDRLLHVTPQEVARNLDYSGGKWYLPPALGQVRGVASKTAEGRDTPLEQQHGIGGVINGLETRKAGDINQLLAGTGLPGQASDYIGPILKT